MPPHSSRPPLRNLPAFIVWPSLLALYVLGAWMSQWLTIHPTDVVLVWPSAGVGFAALLIFGLRAWPLIPIGAVLAHLLVSPVPHAFLALSALTNTVSTVSAALLVMRVSPDPTSMRLRAGLLNLLGALTLALIGGLLGALSLVFADMVPLGDYWRVMARWALGDLFGVIVVAPTLMLAYRSWQLGRLSPHPMRFAGKWERLSWLLALLMASWLVIYLSQRSPTYALGMSFLPLTLLLWAALRLEPLITAFSTTLITLALASVSALAWGGFSTPESTAEVTILMFYLSLLALIPLLFASVSYDARLKTRALLERAATDRLTGLPNRAAFENELSRLIKGSGDSKHALLHLDVDQFKVVNDTVSHRVGDEVIRQVGALLQTEVRGFEGFLARTGGDEFAVLSRRTDLTQALAQAQQLRDAIVRYRFGEPGRVFALTASIGLTGFGATDDPSQVLQAADTACFTAKEQGGNRVQLGDAVQVSAQTTAMNWIVRLNEALEDDLFLLYCQSIAPCGGPVGRGEHFEILLRLRDPRNGQIRLPGEFIAAAERFKLIAKIDRYVVDKTLRFFEQNESARARAKIISINLSSASLSDADFPAFIEERLANSSVAPTQLCFEVTETSAVKDLAHASGFIAQMRALGIGFALDDFGSGFCSFGYLKSLDVDYFKIDGSFVRGILSSQLDLTVVKAIAEIARVLNKYTVAECAETAEIRDALGGLGVDFVQGYAVDEPMPIERYFG